MKWITLFFFALLSGAQAGGVPPLQGKIGEASWSLLVPAHPNGTLLIFAHGFRPEGFPNPAEIQPGKAWQTLLDEGWMIAATSYRANGLVVKEGADDVNQLRDMIAEKYGPVDKCYLHGESMGGTIVTLLAQRDPVRYQGAIAVGAALELLPQPSAPKNPLLFLTNRSEITGPRDYCQKYAADSPRPAVWSIQRDGHVNVNQAELLSALRAISGDSALADRDATQLSNPGPSIATLQNGVLSVTVQQTDHVFGNLTLGLQVADLEKIGIHRGDTFTLRAGSQTRKIFFGKEYADVPEGRWVAFGNADGWMQFAINLGNAAHDLKLDAGKPSTLQIEK